jgi:RNA polymerase sigma factor (TIGR02999 family)
MSEDVTQLLVDWSHGDKDALERLMPLVYDELHRLARSYMRRERSDHTLQPTALVNEAYLRLIDQTRVQWRNRAHFFGVAAQLMRRVTLKHAERQNAAKRGRQAPDVPLEEAAVAGAATDEDLIALNEALEHLEELDERQGRIVELRFYGGLSTTEIGECLGISRATVDREWRLARAWLKRELKSQT